MYYKASCVGRGKNVSFEVSLTMEAVNSRSTTTRSRGWPYRRRATSGSNVFESKSLARRAS